jgi:hypothetical protein
MTITTLQTSHQYARGGLFIRVVTYGYYNIRNTPFTLTRHCTTRSCYLQIFLCLMNKGVTHVHHNRMPDTRTSCTMMTFIMVLYCFEAFTSEVASGAKVRVLCLDPGSPPLRLKLHRMVDSTLQKIRGCVADIVAKRM